MDILKDLDLSLIVGGGYWWLDSLGRDFCGIRVGNHCQGYQSGLSCIGTEGTKCENFSW